MERWRIYIREALGEVTFALRCWSDFRDAEERTPAADVFFHLHHFILHATNVDKILSPKPGTRRSEILRDHVDLGVIDLKACRRLRNHLEHFDERLDNWVERYDGHAFFDRNVVTGATGFPEQAFLRALDGHTFKFHGESYDLDALRDTLEKLAEALERANKSAG